jgi:hypothetical protein
MNRAKYSIPMAGLGLTFVACQDPAVGDFNVAFFDGSSLPLSYTKRDPVTGVACTGNGSATMTVDEELLTTITVNYTYVCDDGSADELETFIFTGTFEVIEKGFTYKINLADDADVQIALDCDMDAAKILFCRDVNDEAFVFQPL